MSSRHPLRTRRRALELSQQELADRVLVNRKTISLIENGHSQPRLILKRSLADALSTSVEELFPTEETS